MVYNHIPRKAIIRTINVQDFLNFAKDDAAVESALRFDVLSMRGDYRGKLRPLLVEGNTALTPTVITVMARVAKHIGLSKDTPIEQLSQVLADLVQGWGFRVDRRDTNEWQCLAATFAHVLCRRSAPAASFQEVQMVKMAFLDGVKWGMGKFNARHKPKDIAYMQRRANAVGLGSPAKIISDELDAAKLHVTLYEKKQERLQRGTAASLLDETPSQSNKGKDQGKGKRKNVWKPVASSSRRTARVLVSEEDAIVDDEDEAEEESEDGIFYE